MRCATIVPVLIYLVLFPCFSPAQRNGELRGLIVSPGAPNFVRLRLQDFGSTIHEIVANDRRFVFENVGPGRYTLVAEAPGFQQVRVDLDFPIDRFIEIELKPLRQEPSGFVVADVSELKVPESARHYFGVARKQVHQNRCTNAFKNLEKAIHIYPQYGDAHRAMAQCYAKIGRPDEAEREFKFALEQIHGAELHLELGMLYARRGTESLLVRQIQFYVAEAARSPLRDRMQALIDRDQTPQRP